MILSKPLPCPALWPQCPALKQGNASLPSLSPFLPCSSQYIKLNTQKAELSFLLLLASCIHVLPSPSHRKSKLLNRKSGPSLLLLLASPPSTIPDIPSWALMSCLHFPPKLCHVLSCFYVLELCWEAPTDSTGEGAKFPREQL